MKCSLFVFFTFFLVLSASAQQAVVIEGHVPSLPDSTMLRLYWKEGRVLQVVDTAYLSGGRFRFDYPLPEKNTLSIMGHSDLLSGRVSVYAEPGITARISGNNPLLATWSVDSPVPEQQESERYKEVVKAETEEYQLLDMQSDRLRNAGRQVSRREREPMMKEYERMGAAKDSLRYRIFEKTLSFMVAREPSVIFMEELKGISSMAFHYPEKYGGLRQAAMAQYERLTPGQKLSEQGREIALSLFPPDQIKIGDDMADAQLPDLSGEVCQLSDYKGKYILLDFWSAGCGPCIMAMPELKEMSERYRDRLTIVGISSDNKRIWEEATEKYGITWVNLNAPGQSEIAAKYGVSGIPHQVIISPAGIVLGSWVGYGKGHLKERLEKYMTQ